MRLVGLAGSLRDGSYNRRLLDAAAKELPVGVELEVWDGLGRLPAFNEDLEGVRPPAAVHELQRLLAEADGVLVATPEYNHSISGVLKNALDWASRPPHAPSLADLPVAVIGASLSAYGAVWAQHETRNVLRAIGARVIDAELPVARAHQAFDDEGRLVDPALRERLAAVLDELLAAAGDTAARRSSTVRAA